MNKSKWIKCKDALPKNNEEYFCWCVDNHGRKYKNICQYDQENKIWLENVSYELPQPLLPGYSVIKWMRED